MKNINSRTVALLILFTLVISLFMPPNSFRAEGNAAAKPTLRILEVQPGIIMGTGAPTIFDLQSTYSTSKYNVIVDRLPIAGFISKIDTINGYYDIVYVGNKTYSANVSTLFHNITHINGATSILVGYDAVGLIPSTMRRRNASSNTAMVLPQGGNNGTDSVEHYSPNDITNRRARVLKDFVESGQLTVFSDSIFTNTSLRNTRLYNNFHGYRNNPAYPNFRTVTSIDINTLINHYETAVKRPSLELVVRPNEYDGSESSYQSDKTMNFRFNIKNNNSANALMKGRLYIDVDGNGMYEEGEVVVTTPSLSSGDGYTINYRIPETFTGLQPWRLEIEDISTGAKTYEQGYTAFKGEPVVIRVLQLLPSGNTLSLRNAMKRPLEKSGEYRVIVTEMSVTQFDNSYPNPVNGVPTLLNQNYDMLVVGFADSFGGNDIRRPQALQAIKDFIATGQSVMFTHDTVTFNTVNVNGWAYNITREFREMLGQNIYQRNAFFQSLPPTHSDKLPMPHPTRRSFGFTRLTLDRANNGNSFPTSTSTFRLNEGLLTMYPYILPENLTVATTHHQYLQLDLEDEEVVPWYALSGPSFNQFDGRNEYYTYSRGNITYSGTGHSAPGGAAEHEFFLNTIIKAARGSNQAPMVEFVNINDGQNISKSRETLEFSFKATDIDVPKDNLLNVELYVGYQNNYYRINEFVAGGESAPAGGQGVTNGQLTVESGKRIDISLVKSKYVPLNVDQFTLKVVAKDTTLAEGVKEIRLFHVDMPNLSVSAAGAAGYLKGDVGNLSFTILPENINSNTNMTIEDIQLRIVPVAAANSYELVAGSLTYNIPNLSIVNGSTSWSQRNETLSVRFKELTQGDPISFNYHLTYTVRYAGTGSSAVTTPQQSHRVHVRPGEIAADVKDAKQRGISNINVQIRNLSTGATFNAATNSTGYVSQQSLTSGAYQVTVSAVEGYQITGSSTRIVNLSYNNHFVMESFVFTGNMIRDVSIVDYFNRADTKSIPRGIVYSRLRFTLNRTADSLEVLLSSDLEGLTIRPIGFSRDGIRIQGNISVNGGRLVLPANLQAGQYQINVAVFLGEDAAVREEPYGLIINSINTTEGGYSDEFVPALNNRLNILVEEKPDIL